jgi:CRP/FNR family transcriptional regulator
MINKLKKFQLFGDLSDNTLLKIEPMFCEEAFTKGSYIFRQGEPAQWLYLLSKGKVKLITHAPTGSSTIIEIYSSGDELTGTTLLEDKPYPASAKALCDGTVIKTSRDSFLTMLSENPAIGYNLMKIFSTRYRGLVENLSSLAVYKVEGRLCRVISNLAKRYGIFGDCRGIILDLALTRQDLADITGTTLETTIRTLNRLKDEGLIKWEGKRFFIPDLHALENEIYPS